MLHLTSCVRADINPTEARDLAVAFDRGDVVIAEFRDFEDSPRDLIGVAAEESYDERGFLVECMTPTQKAMIVAALRAVG